MKKCDQCGVQPANIHVTHIVNGETTVLHLCEECAQKKGITISINVDAPLKIDRPAEGPPAADTQCPECELKLSDFRAKGRLGCASCYAAFEKEIDAVLVQVHGAREHKGKQYKGCEKVLPRDAEMDIGELRKKLDAAVRNEEFELAAELRDTISRIAGRGSAAGKSEILSTKS